MPCPKPPKKEEHLQGTLNLASGFLANTDIHSNPGLEVQHLPLRVARICLRSQEGASPGRPHLDERGFSAWIHESKSSMAALGTDETREMLDKPPILTAAKCKTAIQGSHGNFPRFASNHSVQSIVFHKARRIPGRNGIEGTPRNRVMLACE